MNDFLNKLTEKNYLTKQLISSKNNLVKWVGIQVIKDKNRYGTEINPRSVEIIYLVLIFEMKKDFLRDIDNDITLDMGENIQKVYVDSTDGLVAHLSEKGIDTDDFKPRSENTSYPL